MTKIIDKWILVAEDNLENQELMKDILAELNHSVDIAHDGEEALEKYKKGTYDLVILDVQMPKRDGYEVSLEIRKLERGHSHIPILALTANALTGDRQKCLQAGMDDYITKPIEIDTLEEKLNELFRLFDIH